MLLPLQEKKAGTNEMLGKLFGKKKKTPIEYEDSKLLANDRSVKKRQDLATRADIKPELLYYLAEDKSPKVRKAVANNAATPIQADGLLAKDESDEVRIELARKIDRLLPNLTKDQKSAVQEQTIEILETLAADQLPAVRAMLSESLKTSLVAPKHVIMKLAQDVEASVASPVLEYSPLLSDNDLLEVIASGIAKGALPAVADRQHIGEEVSDAVAASLEVPAVGALLGNPSARVREDTLDSLIEQASEVESLHEPLVMRVDLSIRAMRRIAGFVASSLVEKLVSNNKLSKEVEEELKSAVKGRIKETEDFSEPEEDTQATRAADLFNSGKLNDKQLVEAIDDKQTSFVMNALSLKSEFPLQTVKLMINSRNPKVVTSLCWKAGLSMRTALKIQSDIAHVPPKEMANAKDGVDFPFSDTDMDWQLSFYSG